MNKWWKKAVIFSVLLIMILSLGSCTFKEEKEIALMSMSEILEKSKRADELQQELNSISNELDTSDEEEKDLSEEEAYQNFNSEKAKLEKELNSEIENVLDEIAEEKNLEIVLYKDKSYYGGVDITEDVIELLDQKYYNKDEGGSDDG
ncbi:MAG: hypothetical protein ACQEQF_13080 [Bacillota bacterium]